MNLQTNLFGESDPIPQTPLEFLKSQPTPHPDSPVVVSYGGGKNSTALLILCKKLGIKVDLILFADTGGELPETYAYMDIFNSWLIANGMPLITITRREESTSFKTRQTYASIKNLLCWLFSNTLRVELLVPNGLYLLIWKLYISVSPYTTLEEYCLITEGLPSVAYGIKACSKKFKIEPFEKYIDSWDTAKQAKENNIPIRRLKGIHAKEISRLIGSNGYLLPLVENGYINEYPLIIHGLDDVACQVLIQSEGLPIPSKSSCFFCPNRKIKEIIQLPEYLRARSYLMENVFLNGIHNKSTSSVKGLGRRFAWKDMDNLTPLEQTLLDMQKESKQCNCVD